MGVVFQSDALGNRVHLGVDALYLENKRAFLLYDPVCDFIFGVLFVLQS